MWSLIVVTMSSQIRFELCDCTVVVMWSLNCDHFLWSQFVVTILLFFCSVYIYIYIYIYKFIILLFMILFYFIFLYFYILKFNKLENIKNRNKKYYPKVTLFYT